MHARRAQELHKEEHLGEYKGAKVEQIHLECIGEAETSNDIQETLSPRCLFRDTSLANWSTRPRRVLLTVKALEEEQFLVLPSLLD